MKFNIIESPIAKAIIAGIGAAATFLESTLTPHTAGWIIVGALLAIATVVGTYLQPNVPAPTRES